MVDLRWSRRAVLGGALAALAACASDDSESGGTASSSTAPPTTPATTRPTTVAPTTAAPTTIAPTTTSTTTSTVAPEAATTSPASSGPADDGYVPPADGEWEVVDGASTGWSDEALDEIVAFVGASNSRTFTMLAGGRLLREAYFGAATADAVQDIASCQKSVTSTLVGIAGERGLLGLDDTVSTYLGSGWSRARPAEEAVITVRHLVTMTSGLHPRRLTKVAEPGTVWDYNTEAYQKTRAVLEAASGLGIDALTREWLFDPIGVSALSRWRERPGATDATGAAMWGLAMTARDMARFGLVVRRGGSWAGARVIPAVWLAESLTPIPQKRDYGYLWWLIGRGPLARRGAPPDAVAALGAQDQKIYVVPSVDLVVTRQGLAAKEVSETSSDFDAALIARIAAARR